MDDIFFYDTYALIEIFKDNVNYRKYFDCRIMINKFVFSEYCYFLMKNNVRDADLYTNEIKDAVVDVDLKVIEKAMSFRYLNKKKKMSMVDCISYIQAKKLGIKFLTGDKEFENLENVEFVK